MPLVDEINKLMLERANYLKCLVDENSIAIMDETCAIASKSNMSSSIMNSNQANTMEAVAVNVVHQGNPASTMLAASSRSLSSAKNKQQQKQSNLVSLSGKSMHDKSNVTNAAENVTAVKSNARSGLIDDPAIAIMKNLLK